MGGGTPSPPFDWLFMPSGLAVGPPARWDAAVWHQPVQPTLAKSVSGTVSIATWRNGQNAATQGSSGRLDTGQAPEFGAPSAPAGMTWLFALQIPASAGDFTGIGPCSTQNSTGKNFPLYFKSSTVIGSQPSTSNQDSSLDMTPYYGLDAIITVRQQASGIRFSMWIDGVGEVITTAAGQATHPDTSGLTICAWDGTGGEYPFPIGMVGGFLSVLSDGDQDATRDWAAEQFAIPGA